MDKAQTKAPARSLVSIDDVGPAIAFLALDGAKLITGSVMYIDGITSSIKGLIHRAAPNNGVDSATW